MPQIRVEIEIAASPEEVRAMALDFARYHEWNTSFIQHISTIPPGRNAIELSEGDNIHLKASGVTLAVVVKSNNPTEFTWYGSIFGGAFAGTHIFKFSESHVTPGGTTFVHGEDCDGWMAWLCVEGVFGIGRQSAVNMFAHFSKDLKSLVESTKRVKDGIRKS